MPFPPDGPARQNGWQPDDRLPTPSPFDSFPTFHVPPPRRKFVNRLWLHVVLFVATLLLTTAVGALHYHSFLQEFDRRDVPVTWALAWQGLWYSLTLLGILGAHEMGHYVFCRRYDVDASLPYFLPAPLPLTGTLGAVIKIREAFPTRTVLFDIGVAGPLAGFIVLVPALFVGLSMSTVVPEPPPEGVFFLGEPLLFQWAAQLMFGALPAGQTLNMHPMVFAAWFGMLATALNLLPFGQLDGGHITYATLGRWATPLSLATIATAILLTFNSSSWLFMTVMMVLMLLILGPRHPRVLYEYEPLAPGRRAVALLALVIFVICFTPVPIDTVF